MTILTNESCFTVDFKTVDFKTVDIIHLSTGLLCQRHPPD